MKRISDVVYVKKIFVAYVCLEYINLNTYKHNVETLCEF
jgi:hypothetical protein